MIQQKTDFPLISIITVVFNGEKTIRKTIESVGQQDYPNIEYIICDGASTDRTTEIISSHTSIVTHCFSEPDTGVYDAMNKCISITNGQWLIFLGCDDYFANSSAISSLFEKASDNTSLVYGNIMHSDGKYFLSKLDATILIGNTIHHQASLYSKDLFKDFLYDTNYKICSDYELNLLVYLRNYKSSYLNETISICGITGISAKQKDKGNEEINIIRGKYVNPFNNFLVSCLQRTIRLLYDIRYFFKSKFISFSSK
jgi:putative colanic acid biosynthesis glycosyltransferase